MLDGFKSAITISVFGTSNMAAFAAANKKLDQFAGSFEKASERVKRAGMKTALVGLGIAASLALPIASMAKLDTQVARTGGIAEATAAQVRAIGDTAMYLGATSTFTAQQVAEGQSELASMGLTADQVSLKTGIMADTIAFATGQQVAMADSGALLVGTLNAYQKPLSGATQLSDQFTVAMNKTNLKFADLQESMVNTASTSASFGQSIETNLAVLGVLANRNETGARAGTRLAMTMTKLYTQAGKVNKTLGVNVYDKATGKTRDFIEVFSEIQTKMKSMSEEAKNTTLTDVFGAEGIKVFNILMSSSREELMGLRGSIAGADGAAKEFEDRILNTPTGHWLLMKSAVDGVSKMIGKSLLPMTIALMDGIRGIADSIFGWMSAHPVLSKFMVTMVGVSAVGLTLGGILLFVGGGLLHLGGMALQLPAKLGAFAKAMGVTQSASIPMIASLKALGLAGLKMIWPFALAGLALYAIVKAWDTNFMGFKDTVEEVWFAVRGPIIRMWTTLKEWGASIADVFNRTIGAIWNWAKQWYDGFFGNIGPVLMLAGVVAYAMGYMVGLVMRSWNWIKENPIVSGLLFASLAAFTWPLIWSAATAAWTFAVVTVKAGARAAWGIALAGKSAFLTGLQFLWTGAKATILSRSFWSLSNVVKIGTAIMKGFNLVLKMNPIGIVVGLILALVGGIVYAYTHFEWFRNMLDTIWDGFLWYLNLVISEINLLIKAINLIPGVEIPMVPKFDLSNSSKDATKAASKEMGLDEGMMGMGGMTGMGDVDKLLQQAPRGTKLTAVMNAGMASGSGTLPKPARSISGDALTPAVNNRSVTNVDRRVSVAKIEVVSGPNTPAKSITRQVIDGIRYGAGEEDGIDGVSYAH